LPDGEGGIERRGLATERRLTLLAMGLAAVVLVTAIVATGRWRPQPASEPATSAPSATPIADLTQLPEDAKWGRVWSLSNGIAVYRPRWLPPQTDGYNAVFWIDASTSGLSRYRFSYYVKEPATPGRVVRSVEFMAARDTENVGLVAVDAPREHVTVLGSAAELVGTNVVPIWEISWSEPGYRYGIEAVGFSREELLRIADSLAQVIDERGAIRT
jgi:hypothetical protein